MVKRAYLEQALRFHPDRLQDRTADALERAEFRMREINAAWEVLRNPAARARYDDELRTAAGGEAAGVPVGRPAGTGAGTRWQPGPDPVWDQYPGGPQRPPPRPEEPSRIADLAPAGAPEPQVSMWWKLAPVLLGGAVLLVLVVAAASSIASRDGKVGLDTREELPVGSCAAIVVDESAGTAEPGRQAQPLVIEMPCDGPNSGRIVDKTRFPLSCGAGRPHLLPDQQTIICLAPA